MGHPVPVEQSEIVHHKGGGTTISGRDAVSYYRACTIQSALHLYARTGLLVTRGARISVLLRLATEYTGKAYKRTEATRAADELRAWCLTMKAALPIRDERLDD